MSARSTTTTTTTTADTFQLNSLLNNMESLAIRITLYNVFFVFLVTLRSFQHQLEEPGKPPLCNRFVLYLLAVFYMKAHSYGLERYVWRL